MRPERTADSRTLLLSEILASVARAAASGAVIDVESEAAAIFAGIPHSPLDQAEIGEQIADLAQKRGIAILSRRPGSAQHASTPTRQDSR